MGGNRRNIHDINFCLAVSLDSTFSRSLYLRVVLLNLSVVVLVFTLFQSSVSVREHHSLFLLILFSYGTLAPPVGQEEAAPCTAG